MNVNDSWLADTPSVRPPDGEPRTRSNGSVAPGPDRKANILMVDDRPEKLLALEAVLGSLNQNLVRAKSGKDALRHLLKDQFAVILLDVAMPDMDGFETASLIRKRSQTEHTPIIFIT